MGKMRAGVEWRRCFSEEGMVRGVSACTVDRLIVTSLDVRGNESGKPQSMM